MNNSNKRHFLGGFGGVDILDDFPKKADDDLNPYTGVSENEKRIKLEIGLPKFNKEDIKVTIDERVVSVHGSKSHRSENSTKNKIEFKRSFQVPNSIQPEDISVSHNERILSLIMPKKSNAFNNANVIK